MKQAFDHQNLTDLEYYVTQQSGTEPPFNNAYWQTDAPGLYVDVVDGHPLFLSTDKFPSSCGWPAFCKPVGDTVRYIEDNSHGMNRVEVRSASANSHLGHVFPDGPTSRGGLRYCINSAALRFIPYDELEEKGYGQWKKKLDAEMKKNPDQN